MARDFETYERAEELYIVDGLTLEQVSKATGLSTSVIEKWSAENGWKDKRKEYRQALGEIKRNTVLLRKRLIAKAMKSLEPQDVYAVSRLESATKRGEEEPEAQVSGEIREIRTAQDAVDALQEALERKLNIMLSQPGEISLRALKDMKGALALMDDIKAKYQKDIREEKRGLSDETVEQIKRKILGIL